MTLPRDEDGQLSAWAFPGGYPLFYLDGDFSVLCVVCARKSDESEDELDQFRPIAADVNYEDDSLECQQCGALIKSAYGGEK